MCVSPARAACAGELHGAGLARAPRVAGQVGWGLAWTHQPGEHHPSSAVGQKGISRGEEWKLRGRGTPSFR